MTGNIQDEAQDSPRRKPSVFLSYASADRPAARALRDVLGTFGLDVWYDESELDGGDAWDQKIRRQIRECDYFMPVVSATTQARAEGYFRREWRLAVERTLDMADDHTFLVPVVIDNTEAGAARVPEKFLSVQWVRAPAGQPTPALEALCRRLAAGETTTAAGTRPSGRPGHPNPNNEYPSSYAPGGSTPRGSIPGASIPGSSIPGSSIPGGPAPGSPAPAGSLASSATPGSPAAAAATQGRSFPEFPRQEPGQPVRFWVHVAGWALQCAWLTFQRLPKWLRYLGYAWLFVVLVSRGCTPPSHRNHERLSPSSDQKLKAITDQYQGSTNSADIEKLGSQIAREFADVVDEKPARSALLAIPFTAPPQDSAAAKLADSTFAQVYGRIALARHGRIALSEHPLSASDLTAALEQGRTDHSKYVLYGAVETHGQTPVLTVQIAKVEDGSVVSSDSYPASNIDPAKIAADVDARVPADED